VGQPVEFWGVDHLLDQRAVRHEIAEAACRIIPRFHRDQWDDLVQSLLDACEDEPDDWFAK
jgi:hypothetical protein